MQKEFINICDFGAVGDGKTLDTHAIQKALDKGGRIYCPPGTYLCGTLYLKSNTMLYLEHGAIIKGSPNLADYNPPDFCKQNSVSKAEHTSGGHLIAAVEQENIIITGKGRIDGSQEAWFNKVDPKWANTVYNNFLMPELRPAQMIYFCECRNVTVENIEIFNAPYWSCFFHGCSDVKAHGLTVRNDKRGHNGDGIGLDCVRNAIVSDCNIDTSDDCITLRSCSGKLSQPYDCQNIVISNCVLSTNQAGIRIGLGSGTKISDAVISNIVVRSAGYGVVICASWRGDQGAKISNISFNNMILNAQRPLDITTSVDYHGNGSGTIDNISFSHIRGTGVYPNGITGSETAQITRMFLSDIVLEYPHKAGCGLWDNFTDAGKTAFYLEHVKASRMENLQLYCHISWEHALRMVESDVDLVNCKLDGKPSAPEIDKWVTDTFGHVLANFRF